MRTQSIRNTACARPDGSISSSYNGASQPRALHTHPTDAADKV